MKHLTPMKAMRAKCLDCSCQQPKEVRLCPVPSCALWPYRMGKRPKKEPPQKLVAVDGEAEAIHGQKGNEHRSHNT